MSCDLSSAGAAFSAILTAFIGSVVNGLFSGYKTASITGWISWFALFRILHGGVYMLVCALKPDHWSPGPEDEAGIPMTSRGAGGSQPREQRRMLSYLWPPSPYNQYQSIGSSQQPDQTLLTRFAIAGGWIGWVWTALYSPTTQILWLLAHIDKDDGPAKLVKGLTVAVTAMPLCLDCKARFGASLSRRFGVTWLRYAFNITNAISCLLQGCIAATLLIIGITSFSDGTTDAGTDAGTNAPSGFPSASVFPIALGVAYPICALLFFLYSLHLIEIRDGPQRRAADGHWAGYLIDVAAGAFVGIGVAAPAFALYQTTTFATANSSGSRDLSNYLDCETELWRKIAAVFP